MVMIMGKLYFVFVSLALLLAGCHNNRWNVDVSQSKVDVDVVRFEQDLFSIPADSIWNYVPYMEKKYGRFYDLFNNQIIRIGGTNQLDYDQKLAQFLTDPDIRGAYEEVNKTFGKLTFIGEINDGFAHLKHYYPEKQIPKIYTHISGFNQSVVVDSGYISISLDKYLGSDHKYYQMLRTPLYLQKNMHPAKIPTDVMLAYGLTEFEYKPVIDNLLSQMLYNGKIHVFLDAMMPNAADSLKWGYSSKQMEWCKKNEKQMWVSMVDQKVLFSSSFKEINRYINPGPFTPAFPRYSPGGVGQWLGYRIVLSYLDNNPEVSLQKLMAENDYQKILNLSKYHP
jgi:hypothetical protein